MESLTTSSTPTSASGNTASGATTPSSQNSFDNWQVGRHESFTLPDGQSYRAFVPELLSAEVMTELTDLVAAYLEQRGSNLLYEWMELRHELEQLNTQVPSHLAEVWRSHALGARVRASAAIEGYGVTLSEWLDYLHYPRHASPDRELLILQAQLQQAQAQRQTATVKALKQHIRAVRDQHQHKLQQVALGWHAQQKFAQLLNLHTIESLEHFSSVASSQAVASQPARNEISNQLLLQVQAYLMGMGSVDSHSVAKDNSVEVYECKQEATSVALPQNEALAVVPPQKLTWRETQNYIGARSWERAIYVPPPPQFVSELMQNLEQFYGLPHLLQANEMSDKTRVNDLDVALDTENKNSETTTTKFSASELAELRALVQLAEVHYQLVTIHPWFDGNGRMARMLSGAQLQQWGGIGSAWINLERELLLQRSSYYYHLTAARRGELGAWVVFILEALVAAGRKGVTNLRQLVQHYQLVHDKFTALYTGKARADLLASWEYVSQQLVVSISRMVRDLGWTRACVVKNLQLLEKHQILRTYTSNPAIKTQRYVYQELYDLWR